MARKGGMLARLKRHYDKLIAVTVLTGLLFSLLYLAVTGGNRLKIEEEYLAEVRNMRIQHAKAAEIDPATYAAALEAARHPYQMPAASNDVPGFFVTERRVYCEQCRLPILFEAKTCPFCKTEQPQPVPDDELDTDGDGLKNGVERAYGLNPQDPADADQDFDDDGFSNRDEIRARTDLRNPDDHPPVDVLLRVQKIEGKPLPLRFMGKIELPDGRIKAQINVAGGRTYLLAKGDRIEATAFVLENLEVRRLMRRLPGYSEPRETGVWFAILDAGGQKVELELGRDQVYTEFTVTFVLPLDGTTYTAQRGATFVLRGAEYRVIDVDSAAGTVVIRSESDKRELNVPR